MSDAASQRLIIAHDRGLVALSRFERNRGGHWERLSSTAPAMLETLPLSRAEIVEYLLRHPDFGDLIFNRSPDLQVVFQSVDGKAGGFEGLGVLPQSLPRSVAVFQEAQRQQAVPAARTGMACFVISVELHELRIARLVASEDRWEVESEVDLGSPLDDEVSSQDPIDQVANHLAAASKIARVEFDRVQVREIIGRQLKAYEREASSVPQGGIQELEFVIPPLSPLGCIEFHLPVATLFPEAGARLRAHVRELQARRSPGDAVIVAGRAATFAWVKDILRAELGGQATILDVPEFAAVRGGSLGTGGLLRERHTFATGELEITDGAARAVMAVDLTRSSRFSSKGALRSYLTPAGDTVFDFKFRWKWPSGEVQDRLLTISSTLPRWVATPTTARRSGPSQARTCEFEIRSTPEAMISITLNYPFQSNTYSWDLNA